MKRFIKSEVRLAVLLILLSNVILGCSDDSTGPGGAALGEVTLTVSGDVQAERSGQADFSELEASGIYSWSLDFHDFGPQTFSLTFGLIAHEEIPQPGTGTYEIGFEPANPFVEQGEPVFSGIYTHIENQDFANAVEFETGILCADEFPRGGELTITSSSSDEIIGTFQFTAVAADFDDSGNCINNGAISITGAFTATPRVGA
jgi:hypothetical protein